VLSGRGQRSNSDRLSVPPDPPREGGVVPGRDNVNGAAEKAPQLLLEAIEMVKRRQTAQRRVEVDDKVIVASRFRIPASHRAEDPDVRRPVPECGARDLRSFPAQAVQRRSIRFIGYQSGFRAPVKWDSISVHRSN